MSRRIIAWSLAPMVLIGCAATADNMQGPLQPQTVSGPCQVERFFTLAQRSVPVRMMVSNTGQACTFTLFNPALNLTLNAALLTGPASHGLAATDLVNGRRQVGVAYTPAPGYAGPDRFSVTYEPGGSGVTVDVMVAGR